MYTVFARVRRLARQAAVRQRAAHYAQRIQYKHAIVGVLDGWASLYDIHRATGINYRIVEAAVRSFARRGYLRMCVFEKYGDLGFGTRSEVRYTLSDVGLRYRGLIPKHP